MKVSGLMIYDVTTKQEMLAILDKIAVEDTAEFEKNEEQYTAANFYYHLGFQSCAKKIKNTIESGEKKAKEEAKTYLESSMRNFITKRFMEVK